MSSVRRACLEYFKASECLRILRNYCVRYYNVVYEGKAKGEERSSDICEIIWIGASSTWNSSFISSRVRSLFHSRLHSFSIHSRSLSKILNRDRFFLLSVSEFISWIQRRRKKSQNFCNGKNILIRYKKRNKNSNDERCVRFNYNYDGSKKSS